jgi:1,2-phenylacetyl-CoA epoxidase PaaB subunit
MKNTVIHKFVDNKIRTAFCERKNSLQVIGVLEQKIELSDSSDRRGPFQDYMKSFMKKRIYDILLIKSKQKFNKIPDHKILLLIQFKDKVSGYTEFDIRKD